jgi:glycosyltransferase involved in cell wall biosynthesis
MSTDFKKSPIRVCFVIPKAYPLFHPEVKGVFGGSEVDMYQMGIELALDSDFSVRFVVADYGQADEEEQNGIRIIKSLDFTQNSLAGAKKIWRALKCADADMYIVKTLSPGVPLTAYYCKKNQKAFIYRTANEQECDGSLIQKHFLLGRAFVWALRKAQVIFTQNQKDTENLKQSLGLRAVLIPNGHPLPEYVDTEREIILWSGRSSQIKRPDLILDLAQAYPEQKFVMICQEAFGEGGYEELVREAEGIENLEFLPRVGFQAIDAYFQRAKVLVNTSDSEGFPNTFIQACTWGTPILSLQVNPDGFLDRYQCGKCAEGDWERFVEMLAELTEPGTQKKYGQNARRYVEEHHDIKIIIEEYKRIFRALMSQGE